MKGETPNTGGVRGAGAGPADARAARSPAARPPAELRPVDTGVLELSDALSGDFEQQGAEQDAIAPFTDVLGARLGAANPVWGANAVGLLRNLQKKLVAHSLTLEHAERRPCLDAIEVLEVAVGLRLRLRQMELSEQEDAAPGAGNQAGDAHHHYQAG
ncbi:MAG: hypothetical protein V4754_19010 [Pseudomonadota bacterium]